MEPVRTSDPTGVGGLLLRFVNTRAITQPIDDFAEPSSAKEWLLTEGLIDQDALVTDADVLAARELRAALVSVLKDHVGAEDATEAESANRVLERAGAAHPLRPQITPDGSAFVPAQTGPAGALGAVLADTATLGIDEREWSRFKVCKNPVCYRGFRDNSKPRTALYCSHTCASQVGMRAYRGRNAR